MWPLFDVSKVDFWLIHSAKNQTVLILCLTIIPKMENFKRNYPNIDIF